MRSANAPSQAHLQGTQSQPTKANLAKEPALFLRFRDTPCHGGHRHSIQVTKTKGEHITWGLLLCWLTNIFSSFYSLSAAVPADVILFSFLLLTSSSYFQSAAVPGWTFNEYQHSSKPCPLPAMPFEPPFINEFSPTSRL